MHDPNQIVHVLKGDGVDLQLELSEGVREVATTHEIRDANDRELNLSRIYALV